MVGGKFFPIKDTSNTPASNSKLAFVFISGGQHFNISSILRKQLQTNAHAYIDNTFQLMLCLLTFDPCLSAIRSNCLKLGYFSSNLMEKTIYLFFSPKIGFK